MSSLFKTEKWNSTEDQQQWPLLTDKLSPKPTVRLPEITGGKQPLRDKPRHKRKCQEIENKLNCKTCRHLPRMAEMVTLAEKDGKEQKKKHLEDFSVKPIFYSSTDLSRIPSFQSAVLYLLICLGFQEHIRVHSQGFLPFQKHFWCFLESLNLIPKAIH